MTNREQENVQLMSSLMSRMTLMTLLLMTSGLIPVTKSASTDTTEDAATVSETTMTTTIATPVPSPTTAASLTTPTTPAPLPLTMTTSATLTTPSAATLTTPSTTPSTTLTSPSTTTLTTPSTTLPTTTLTTPSTTTTTTLRRYPAPPQTTSSPTYPTPTPRPTHPPRTYPTPRLLPQSPSSTPQLPSPSPTSPLTTPLTTTTLTTPTATTTASPVTTTTPQTTTTTTVTTTSLLTTTVQPPRNTSADMTTVTTTPETTTVTTTPSSISSDESMKTPITESPTESSGVYITGPSVTFTSPGKITNSAGITGYHLVVSSSDVTATCSARTPGAWHPVLEWRLGDSDLSGGRGARGVEVKVLRDAKDVFRVTSTLTLRGVTVSDSGNLTCRVRANQKEASGHVILRVVERVSAILDPRTAVVTSGSSVTLKCARIAGYDATWTAVFYRLEGNVWVKVGRRQVVQENSTELQLTAVTSGHTHQCNVTDPYGWALSNEADIIIEPEAAAVQCRKDGKWPTTPAGNTVRLQCPEGYSITSFEQRTCSAGGQWGNTDTSQCVNQELQGYKNQIKSGRTSINTTWKVVRKVANRTSGLLLTGDVITVADILDKVVTVTTDTNHEVQSSELQDFLQSADNLLNAPTQVWRNHSPVALNLVHSVDKIGKAATSNEAISTAPIETDKIVLEVGKAKRGMENIVFPHPSRRHRYPGWIRHGSSSVLLSKHAFPHNVTDIRYSAVIFRNLTNVFSTSQDQASTDQSQLFLNSPVLAISLQRSRSHIRRPVRLTFQHISSNFSRTSCQFLNFSAREGGRWSTSGCRVDVTDSERTVCLCDHLTNFAVLMSPYRPTSTVADVLNIFSIVGCGVSILCLLLTLIIYRVFWRYVKSDRSVILVNLCVILILAYVTFLAGVNRVQYKTLCTVVAALLHYLWLVVFCLMLCEGLDIFISIVIIFPTKSVLLKLLLMAYGVPAVIVGAAMGITRLEGYGGEDFCWLSLKNNLLWAFVGPALAALLTNFVFVALVVRALLSSSTMITKANRERAKSVVRAICVMTPILGLTWIFGVMAVNDDTLLFQVLFVVFNSLQGLMIFVFHCLMSKQVREGIRQRRRRLASKQYASHSHSQVSTLLCQNPNSLSSVSSNDLGESTTPIPPAHQSEVQQITAKMTDLMDSPNLLTPDDPPKVTATFKDTLAVVGEIFLNIQFTESGEGGPSYIQIAPTGPHSPHPPAAMTTTTESVVEKERVRPSYSLEDNELQPPTSPDDWWI